jgi:hypothetical protein
MTIIRNASYSNERFVLTPREIATRTDISNGARGLLTLLLAQPEGFKVRTEWVYGQSADGRYEINADIRELEVLGYVKRVRRNDEHGRFEWTFYVNDIAFADDEMTDEGPPGDASNDTEGLSDEPSGVTQRVTISEKTIDGKTTDGLTIDGKTTDGKTANGGPTFSPSLSLSSLSLSEKGGSEAEGRAENERTMRATGQAGSKGYSKSGDEQRKEEEINKTIPSSYPYIGRYTLSDEDQARADTLKPLIELFARRTTIQPNYVRYDFPRLWLDHLGKILSACDNDMDAAEGLLLEAIGIAQGKNYNGTKYRVASPASLKTIYENIISDRKNNGASEMDLLWERAQQVIRERGSDDKVLVKAIQAVGTSKIKYAEKPNVPALKLALQRKYDELSRSV